jgi:hypothetical protein
MEEEFAQDDVYTPRQIKDFLLYRKMLNTNIPQDYIATK